MRHGLGEAGYVEGKDVAIEYRWANGQYDRLPALAADLVARKVTVIVSTGGDPPALAAKAATTTIPIVFATGSDPVAVGLVAGLSRPGGNLTGVTVLTSTLEAKRMGLLRELVPKAEKIGILINPNYPLAAAYLRDAQEAAVQLGAGLVAVNASAENDFEPAFASLMQQSVGALMIIADPFFNSRRDQLVAYSARHKIPTMYEFREFAAAGGLITYGTNLAEAYRQVGLYTGRILKGENPANLPVVQSAKFEMVINMKTAKALGLAVPNSMQLLADEVIE
jgi:putative tryptophan/tyrosine transport system substrate-binding protein